MDFELPDEKNRIDKFLGKVTPNSSFSDESAGKEIIKEIIIPNDQELRNLLNESKIIDKFNETGTEIFECSPNQLFDICFNDNAVLPYDEFWKAKIPSRNQTVQKWLTSETPIPHQTDLKLAHNLSLSSVIEYRICEADILQIKTSHLKKLMMIVEKQANQIKLRVLNIVSGVPYCDSFYPEEEWVITSLERESPRCIVRHSAFINFHKSSMMQGMISGRAFTQ